MFDVSYNLILRFITAFAKSHYALFTHSISFFSMLFDHKKYIKCHYQHQTAQKTRSGVFKKRPFFGLFK